MVDVLIGWEFGSGLGHIYPLFRIGRELLRRGLRVSFAAKDVCNSAQIFQDVRISIFQAPSWPQRSLPNKPYEINNYADLMSLQGFSEPKVLGPVLAAWESLLSIIKPKVIIADHSPGLALASRGNLAFIAIGNGFTLPPTGGAAFPNFIRGPKITASDELLESINAVQHAQKRPTLDYLPRLFDREAGFLTTIPILDPYHRELGFVGPIEESINLATRSKSSERSVFLYAFQKWLHLEKIQRALMGLNINASGYIHGATPDVRRSELTLEDSPVCLPEKLANSSVLIHTGGNSTASLGAMLGIPQLILPIHHESRFTAHAIEAAGSGIWLKTKDLTEVKIRSSLTRLTEDLSIRNRSAMVANTLEREYDLTNAIKHICDGVAKCL